MKDILVHCDGGSEDSIRISIADRIASRFKGSWSAVFATELPPLPIAVGSSVGMAIPTDFGQYDETIAHAKQSKSLLDEKLANRSKPVNTHLFIEQAEALARKVAELSRTFDVFLTTLPSEGAETNTSHLLDQVLVGGGGGALALPTSFVTNGLFQRITIAWNGSREASRAVGFAMPLLQAAVEVTVLLVDQPLRTAGDDIRPGQDIMSHLDHHKVNCVLARVTSGEMKTFEAILAETAKNEAQLLVMGAQAEGGLMQWFRGSVSRQVLSAAPIPLFLAH
jgi:nucleotide-binding universal stress UspA family protein